MRRCISIGVFLACHSFLLALSSHPTVARAQTSVGTPFPIAINWASVGSAFDGTNWLVAMESGSHAASVAGQLISQNGTRVGPLIAIGATGQACCNAVAFDGVNYLMVWEDDSVSSTLNSTSYFGTKGQFISTAGVTLGQPFAITNADVWLDGVRFLVFGGGKYLLTYYNKLGYVAGRLISPDGTVGGELRISAGSGAGSSIGFDGTNFLVVWNSGSEVRGTFVSPAGTLGQEISINASPASSDNLVHVAFDGTNYLVVFHDAAGAAPTTPSLVGTWALSSTNDAYSFPTGSVFTLDASGNYTSTMPGCTHTGTVSVSGTVFVMNVLTSTSYGCIAPGSTITGTVELTANTAKLTNGGSWGLFQRTTGQSTATTPAWNVFGQRVSPAGALVGGVIPISNDPGAQLAMGIAFDGTNYLTAWTDMQSSTNYVYGRFISKDGALVGDRLAIDTNAGNQFGGIAGYANGKYIGFVNTGAQIGSNGLTLAGGGVYGSFIGTYRAPPNPDQPVAPPPTAQTEYTVPTGQLPAAAVTTTATGTLGSVTLTVTLDLSKLSGGSFAGLGQFASGYNIYVLALVPGGALGLPSATWITLSATRGWSVLGLPVAAYMEGLAQNATNRVEIAILQGLNLTGLVGTEFYIGYGTDEYEMVTQGRFRGVYKVQ